MQKKITDYLNQASENFKLLEREASNIERATNLIIESLNTNNKDITINGSYDFYGGTNNTSRTLNLGSSTISGNVFYIYAGGLTLN